MATSLTRRMASGRVAADGMLRAAVRRGVETLLTWHERARQRRHLAALDDGLLHDLGLTRSMVGGEIEKPFWKP